MKNIKFFLRGMKNKKEENKTCLLQKHGTGVKTQTIIG